MGLDTVEILLSLESSFGFQIQDIEARQLRTTRDIIDFVCLKLKATDAPAEYCLSMRAFYKLRQSLVTAQFPRTALTPDAAIKQLFPGPEGKAGWSNVGRQMGFSDWPGRGTCLLIFANGPGTLGQMAHWLVTHHPRSFMENGAHWTRGAVRQVVRSIVADAIGTTEFSDDADIVRELGVD